MALSLRDRYLLVYNAGLGLLWLHTVYLLCAHVPQHILSSKGWGDAVDASAVAALYTKVSPSALAAQRLSWLEVAHVAAGLVGGGVGAAFTQALGRSAVLLVLVEVCASARGHPAAVTLIAVAAVSDLLRYAFYVAGIVGRCPRALLVARYSAFLVAYPIGIACEWLLYYVSLGEIDALAIGRVTMPNSWNWAFDYGIWNRVVLVTYAYFGPSMFMHMLRQRRKKLAKTD